MRKKTPPPATQADNTATNAAETMDIKEVIFDLDACAGLLGSAEQSFVDVGSIFEAIAAASPKGSLASRLARLGINFTASLECDYEEYTHRYASNAERYSASLATDPLRRFRATEESSLDDV
jgi:hypothetical protein